MTEETQLTTEDVEALKALGYPHQEEKQGIFTFFNKVIDSLSNSKTANLTEDELGAARIPVRTNLEIAGYCEVMGMQNFAQCFKNDAQILLATSLSREGFLDTLAVTQKRESFAKIKKINPNIKKGWFKSKQPIEQ